MLVKRRPLLGSVPRCLSGFAGSRARRGTRLRLLRSAGVLLAGGMLLVVVLAGIQNLGWFWSNRVLPEIRTFGNWQDSASATPRRLDIDVKFKDFRRLAYLRQQAFDIGRIVQREDSYVPAKIRLPDRTVKVKMRLKGDAIDHLEGDKWSLRINVKGNDAIFGMSLFSIQDPVRSSFVDEWVFHEMMRREGFIAPRYDFIHVTINGKPMGIYALEEGFSKELLEAHGRREGPIVRFDESKIYVEDPPNEREVYFAVPVDAFQSRKTGADPVLRDQFTIAQDLLEGFRDQRLRVDQVFNLNKTATYFALIDLLSAGHASRWKNIRFYYDPITSLLEPIPYNAYTSQSAAGARQSPVQWLSGQHVYSRFQVPEWTDTFFRNPTFYRMYVRAVARVSDAAFVRRFFTDIDDQLREKLQVIHKDDPAFNYSNDYILDNARIMRNAVMPKLPLRVRFDLDKSTAGPTALEVANTVWLEVELTGILDRETGARYPFRDGLVIAPLCTDVPRYVTLRLPEPARDAFAAFADGRFDLAYHVLGMPEEYSAPIEGHRPTARMNLRQRHARDVETIAGMEALRVDEANKTITVMPGTWRFDRSLQVPAGYVLHAGAGVTIELQGGASLISYSPVRFMGTAKRPIVILSLRTAGGGLAVIEADGQSSFRHVRFENLASPREGLWTVTGAVTLYESPVHIADCRFTAGLAEDQLNIVRADFTLQRCEFSGSTADALDVDFSRGRIADCTFTDSQDDAVDLSGSRVTVERCRIRRAGDKALSAGENSFVTVRDFEAADCRFGVVSKDLSAVTAQDVTVRRAEIALAAYKKKPEYGPASITIERLGTEDTVELFLIEKGSWISINGHETRGVKLAVARAIYGE